MKFDAQKIGNLMTPEIKAWLLSNMFKKTHESKPIEMLAIRRGYIDIYTYFYTPMFCMAPENSTSQKGKSVPIVIFQGLFQTSRYSIINMYKLVPGTFLFLLTPKTSPHLTSFDTRNTLKVYLNTYIELGNKSKKLSTEIVSRYPYVHMSI